MVGGKGGSYVLCLFLSQLEKVWTVKDAMEALATKETVQMNSGTNSEVGYCWRRGRADSAVVGRGREGVAENGLPPEVRSFATLPSDGAAAVAGCSGPLTIPGLC